MGGKRDRRKREKERERETDRETDRERQTERKRMRESILNTYIHSNTEKKERVQYLLLRPECETRRGVSFRIPPAGGESSLIKHSSGLILDSGKTRENTYMEPATLG